MAKAYYNEFDPKAAAWLRQLIENGNIAPGEVDERSITEVTANDLSGFSQHHFFAGIGVWSYALRNAGWDDSRPVWTASLPCQPFSVAGNQKGKDDERHLLPHFIELVKQCRPDAIFGEQVESAIRHEWLDDLQTNMEGEGYALGHCVLGAHSIGKAHIRKRLYWVATSGLSNAISERRQCEQDVQTPKILGSVDGSKESREQPCSYVPASNERLANASSEGLQGGLSGREDSERKNINGQSGRDSSNIGMADSDGEQCQQGLQSIQGESSERNRGDSEYSRMGDTQHNGQSADKVGRGVGESKAESGVCEPERPSAGSRLGHSEHNGCASSEIRPSNVQPSKEWREERQGVSGKLEGASGREKSTELSGCATGREGEQDSIDWLYCRDNKCRPIKSGIKPLVDGVARGVVHSIDSIITPNDTAEARAQRLKGYGNAIVAPVAQVFIESFMSI